MAGRIGGNLAEKGPKETVHTVEVLSIGDTTLIFAPARLSIAPLRANVVIEPAIREYTLRLTYLPDRTKEVRGGYTHLFFTPTFDAAAQKPRIWIKDGLTGKEWELYPTNVVFRWTTREQNQLYQKFKKEMTQNALIRFKTIATGEGAKSWVGIEDSDSEDTHESLFMYNLKFLIAIEPQDIIYPIPQIKNTEKK